jgi:hypothetical protein
MALAKLISMGLLAASISLTGFAQGKPDSSGKGQHRPGPHFGDWLRKNLNTPPAQKQKALEDDPSFQKLPPERQQRLKSRLEWFNSLAPERQQLLLKRMEAWEHMPADQRKQARSLLDQMRAMPDDRRTAMWNQVRSFSVMTTDERQKAMNSDQYKHGFSDQERNMMQEWLRLRDTASEDAQPTLDDPPEH